MTLISSAQTGLATAVGALDANNPTAAQITAVNEAITLLANALAAANDLSPNQTKAARDALATARTTVTTAQATLRTGMATAERIRVQMGNISTAQTTLASALEGDDLAASNAAYDALETAIEAGADLTDAQKAAAMTALDMADVTIAKAELAAADAAAMATGATDEEKLAAYQDKLTAARRLAAASAASATDLATANQAIGMATAKIAELEEDIQDATDTAADDVRKANNVKAEEVATAIGKHKLAGDPVFAGAATGDSVTITRTSGAAVIKPNQTTPVAAENVYAEAAAPSAGAGWSGRTFTRSSTSGKRDVMEMSAVYTDIEMAKDQKWTDGVTGANDTTGAVSVNSLTAVSADRIGSSILGVNVVSGAGKARAGTLYGVSGLFSCDAENGCVATKGADGNIDVTGGTLTFTPTIPTGKTIADVMAKYTDLDGDYTSFGYWMRSKDMRGGAKEYTIQTFHDGSNSTSLTLGTKDGDTLTGTASYYGAAAGVYVKRAGTTASPVVTHGKFTATAMLNANFGGNAIPEDKQYMVSGTISDFMGASGDLGFADLKLNAAAISGAGAISAGTTNGGGKTGAWDGQFYGTVNNPAENDPRDTDDYPMDVSGEFNGHFVDGSVAGAFGAEYDD